MPMICGVNFASPRNASFVAVGKYRDAIRPMPTCGGRLDLRNRVFR
jgi:hypothetical protein